MIMFHVKKKKKFKNMYENHYGHYAKKSQCMFISTLWLNINNSGLLVHLFSNTRHSSITTIVDKNINFQGFSSNDEFKFDFPGQ